MSEKNRSALKKYASQNSRKLDARRPTEADEASWNSYQMVISRMLPKDVASELVAHGREHYFSLGAKKWRESLRARERSRRYVYGGKTLGV